jgi:RimJ/RimL family protein N-acetyltransferase
MNVQLFEGEHIQLTAFEPDRDAEIESNWTHDPDYLRLLGPDPAKPLSPAQVKKRHEELAKEAEKRHDAFNFAIRLRADERLLGLVRVFRIEWTHGSGQLQLGIGAASDRGRGYGAEALNLILRYAFDELNLHRLTAITSDYNPGAIRFFERAGFQVEVRRRRAIQRDGKRWDAVMLGLLREEWLMGEKPTGAVRDEE